MKQGPKAICQSTSLYTYLAQAWVAYWYTLIPVACAWTRRVYQHPQASWSHCHSRRPMLRGSGQDSWKCWNSWPSLGCTLSGLGCWGGWLIGAPRVDGWEACIVCILGRALFCVWIIIIIIIVCSFIAHFSTAGPLKALYNVQCLYNYWKHASKRWVLSSLRGRIIERVIMINAWTWTTRERV